MSRYMSKESNSTAGVQGASTSLQSPLELSITSLSNKRETPTCATRRLPPFRKGLKYDVRTLVRVQLGNEQHIFFGRE